MKATLKLALTSVIALLVAACLQQSRVNDAGTTNRTIVKKSNLELVTKTIWRLTAMTVDGEAVPLVPNSKATLMCSEDGRVGGKASVNQYFGWLNISAKGELDWGSPGFGSTMMAGPAPLMEQERTFLDSLRKTDRMFLDAATDSTLTLESSNGSVVLEFAAVPGEKPNL